MIHQLRFDVTDADTIADSANVGAHIRSGVDGTLIGSHNLASADWLNVASVLYDETGTAISAANPLDVTASINFSYDYAEDSAHASGDIGAYVLSVRQDTLASSTSADGDYASFKVNNVGSLYTHDTAVLAQLVAGVSVTQGTSPWVVSANNLDIRDLVFATDKVDVSGSVVALDAGTLAALESITVQNGAGAAAVNIQDGGNSITVDGTVSVTQSTSPWVVSDAALANTAMVASATSVDNTVGGTDLVASDLANRKYLFVANEGSQKIWVGNSGLTIATGFPIAPGSMLECRAGAAINMYAIGKNAPLQDIRILQLS